MLERRPLAMLTVSRPLHFWPIKSGATVQWQNTAGPLPQPSICKQTHVRLPHFCPGPLQIGRLYTYRIYRSAQSVALNSVLTHVSKHRHNGVETNSSTVLSVCWLVVCVIAKTINFAQFLPRCNNSISLFSLSLSLLFFLFLSSLRGLSDWSCRYQYKSTTANLITYLCSYLMKSH